MGEVGAGCLVASSLLSSAPSRLLGSYRNSRMLELKGKAETLTLSLSLTSEEIEFWDTAGTHCWQPVFLNSLHFLSLSQHCWKGSFTQSEEPGGNGWWSPGGTLPLV